MIMDVKQKTLGAAAAALFSNSLGCLVFGLITFFAERSEPLRKALTWSNVVGPLSGKTSVGIIVWLLSWFILHLTLREKSVNFNVVTVVSFLFYFISLVLLFPPVFET